MRKAVVVAVAMAVLSGCDTQSKTYDDEYLSLTYSASWVAKPAPGGSGVRLGPKDYAVSGPPPITILVVPVEAGQTMQSLMAEGRAALLSNAVGAVTTGAIRIGGTSVECVSFTSVRQGHRDKFRLAQIPGSTCLYTVILRDGTPAPAKQVDSVLASVKFKK